MNSNPLKILIVDDNNDHQILVQERLVECSHNIDVVFAGTGKECMLRLSTETYDAIIIDFNLPDMNGLDILKEMSHKGYDYPVLIVTAHGDENIAVEAMKLGAQNYVVKSEGYSEQLPALLNKIIQEYKLREENRLIESKLKISELKYKALVDNMIDVVFTADTQLNISSINPAGQRVFEYSGKDIIHLSFYDLIHESDKEKIRNYLNVSFADHRKFIEGLEFRIMTGNGITKDIQLNAIADYDKSGNVVQIECVVRDITARKDFEQKLFQIEKLNALGLMSSGFAHEFNNILATILGYLEIAKTELDGTGAQVLDTLKIIEKAARGGETVVDKIQQFSRIKQEYERAEEVVDLHEIVDEALTFTMPRWKVEAQSKGTEYEIITNGFTNAKYHVKFNPSELRDVIINIINNSIDAMPNGGKIEFSAKKDNENVVISISDNGIGIKEEVKYKMFDPFFTTKGVKRSGLGMSLSHSVMIRYGGNIIVDTHQDNGVTIHLRIPLCTAETARSDKKEEVVSSRGVNILMIDDDKTILEMMKIILESKGHSVFTTTDANIGLKMYEDNLYEIVLCDLAMPKINGWKVAKYIKEYDAVRKESKTPVVLITGYELDTEMLNHKGDGVDFILNKPISFEKLYKLINDFTNAN